MGTRDHDSWAIPARHRNGTSCTDLVLASVPPVKLSHLTGEVSSLACREEFQSQKFPFGCVQCQLWQVAVPLCAPGSFLKGRKKTCLEFLREHMRMCTWLEKRAVQGALPAIYTA